MYVSLQLYVFSKVCILKGYTFHVATYFSIELVNHNVSYLLRCFYFSVPLPSMTLLLRYLRLNVVWLFPPHSGDVFSVESALSHLPEELYVPKYHEVAFTN